MNYVSDHTAKSMLRNLVRDATISTPKYEKIDDQLKEVMRKSNRKNYYEKIGKLLGKYALSIAYMKQSRARGTIMADIPYFEEDERGWALRCTNVEVRFCGTDGFYVEWAETRKVFIGHAIERMFQRGRGEILNWTHVKKELAFAMMSSMFYLDAKVGPLVAKQILLPTVHGCFLGTVDSEGNITAKTFVKPRAGGRVDQTRDQVLKALRYNINHELAAVFINGGNDRISYEGMLQAMQVVYKFSPWLMEEYMSQEDDE